MHEIHSGNGNFCLLATLQKSTLGFHSYGLGLSISKIVPLKIKLSKYYTLLSLSKLPLLVSFLFTMSIESKEWNVYNVINKVKGISKSEVFMCRILNSEKKSYK